MRDAYASRERAEKVEVGLDAAMKLMAVFAKWSACPFTREWAQRAVDAYEKPETEGAE